MIRVAIRFDDPSPTSDRGIESRLIASLKAAGLRATFAVTPLGGYAAESPALDSANAASLVQGTREGTIEIGLHGHSHVNVRSGHDRSEFAGLGLKAQLERLESARANLRMVFGSSAAAGFIPPWNSYDLATVRALEQLGFEYLSGG
jgi:peptidoglycan/xylan/chitin deacetylase (PgdA/CDA1 family)